ncbi:MAG: hypothetical protein HQL56_07530 [Magnetococcales bacterium]|nr:hypothetical protein [Magnetococcales bacterium]
MTPFRFGLATCCLCIAASSLAGEAPPAAPAPAKAPAVSEGGEAASGETVKRPFRWPVPSSGLVYVAGKNRDKSTRSQFRIRLVADGENFVVHCDDYRFLEMDGKTFAEPTLPGAIDKSLTLKSIMPSFQVDKNGQVVGLHDYPGLLARLRDLGALGGPEVAEKNFQEMLDNPKIKRKLLGSVKEYWNLWVNGWTSGILPAPGKRISGTTTSSQLGKNLSQPFILSSSWQEGPTGGVRLLLRFEASLQGEEYTNTLISLYSSVLQGEAADTEIAANLQNIDSLEHHILNEIITDPDTMRPYSARKQTVDESRFKNQGPIVKVQESSYTFQWDP